MSFGTREVRLDYCRDCHHGFDPVWLSGGLCPECRGEVDYDRIAI